MEATQQTQQQIERAITKVVGKYSQLEEPVLTDIYIQVKQESGEILVYNDDDVELHRCVIEEWIGNTQEDFYSQIVPVLSQCISNMRSVVDSMQIMRPFSFVLIDEEHETVQDIIYIDNEETVILDGKLLEGKDKELEEFLRHLLED
ncbi:MAG: hypothetical protein J6L60_07210 [Bacteroidaceae bacterium]|nr:hypothetical protein [Bacteroidaceae bacterium]MBR2945917.1 hypothetical protein [Bacteroidaceae bacterium]MDO5489354.1 hypothetical protein [Bacteroidaceae bacterium]